MFHNHRTILSDTLFLHLWCLTYKVLQLLEARLGRSGFSPCSGHRTVPERSNFKCFRLPCFALLCLALPCFALLCLALPCFALLCLALPCFTLLCPALPCFALLCLALPCFALLCLALPCFALLCLALPCFALHGMYTGIPRSIC